MKISLIFLVLLAVSCGAKKSSPTYGKTTLNELLAQKGEPSSENKMALANSKMLNYKDEDISYQVTNDVVISSYENPKKERATLIYWQHQFRNCDIKIETIKKEIKGHEKHELFMRCDSEGRGVIYQKDAEFIFSVVEYEKK